MKKVEAVIPVFKLDEVKKALVKVGIEGLTVAEVRTSGPQRGHTELYRGSEHAVTFLPEIKIELLLEDYRTPAVVDVLWRAARTGQTGDGKVLVCPVEDVVRVRTGQRGNDAI